MRAFGRMSTQTDIAELTACLTRELPDLAKDTKWIAAQAVALVRCEASLRRMYEKACNEPLTPADERRTEALERRAKGLVQTLGLVPELNSDPRGSAIGIYLPSGRSNHMGGDTWRV